MTPEIKRLRTETDRRQGPSWDREARELAIKRERAAVDALLRDILHAAGIVVQEARHHELMPWFKKKVSELERVTTIGGKL